MSTIGNRIRLCRERAGLSVDELAAKLGKNRATIYRYESDYIENMPLTIIDPLAKALDVSPAYLMGWEDEIDNIIPMPSMRTVPLLGTIACGEPILAAENLDGEVTMPENVQADFALRCKGDSMINARIFDGDIVYIRQQDSVQDGEIAAVLIGDEATLKRFRRFDDHVVLEPENPQYRPLTYWGEDAATVRVLGKAVAFTSSVR